VASGENTNPPSGTLLNTAALLPSESETSDAQSEEEQWSCDSADETKGDPWSGACTPETVVQHQERRLNHTYGRGADVVLRGGSVTEVLFLGLACSRWLPGKSRCTLRLTLTARVSGWLRPPSVWVPAEETAKEKEFMDALKGAHGGSIASRTYTHLQLPETIDEVMERIRAAHAWKRPPVVDLESGDVLDIRPDVPMTLIDEPPMTVTAGILFAGGGGSCTGMPPWVDTRVAIDNWDAAVTVLRNNTKTTVWQRDIREWKSLAAEITNEFGRLDFWQLSPPCPRHSRSRVVPDDKAEEPLHEDMTVIAAQLVVALGPTVFLMENVTTLLTKTVSKAIWRLAETIFTEAGYHLTCVQMNAAHCGGPQVRKRLWVLGVRGGTPEIGTRFTTQIRRHANRPMVMTAVKDVLPEVRRSVYLMARNGRQACVLSAEGLVPTLRTTCGRYPAHVDDWVDAHGVQRKGYRPRKKDATALAEATRPTAHVRGRLMGFPGTYDWGTPAVGSKEDEDIARVQGNAVVPQMMQAVAIAAREAGAFAGCGTTGNDSLIVPLPSLEPVLRAELTVVHVRQGKAQPSWRLRPPRSAQSPRLAVWRETHPESTAQQEWASGWGARVGSQWEIVDDRKDRPFITDDPALGQRTRRRLKSSPLGDCTRKLQGSPACGGKHGRTQARRASSWSS
jgi:DNA (cytosine-5)-methyltransferase 1